MADKTFNHPKKTIPGKNENFHKPLFRHLTSPVAVGALVAARHPLRRACSVRALASHAL